ncbi:MAG TPA: hypothetical protein VLX09_11130 [Stellaceae bacterium]|nr:hypothetical protein [Stellaceae bacterium]
MARCGEKLTTYRAALVRGTALTSALLAMPALVGSGSGPAWALVHTGTIDVSGADGGGTIVLNTGDVLQGGILRADGGSGAGGAIAVNFTGNYFGTESAVLSAQGGTQGGSIAIVGGSGSNTPFILTARALSADVAFTQANTTLDGVPFQGPLIAQMRTIVDGVTAPSTQPAPSPYGVVMGQYCPVVRPDGSCEREEATTPNEAIAARGNAYLGDLLYRR